MNRNMRKSTASVILSLLLAIPVLAQPQDKYLDDFKGWIRTLGSDEFGGRKPMTQYEDKTTGYLAGEFLRLGLEPAFGDSYLQAVPEISTTVRLPRNRISIRARGGKVIWRYPEDVMVWTSRAVDEVDLKNVEYVFCGFGIDAPEYGWNDFEGVDVKGKIVIAMVNDPGFYDPSLFRGRNMTYYGRWTYKLEQARLLGAAGCLILHDEAAAGYGWHVCVNGHKESNLALYDEDTRNAGELAVKGWLREEACRVLFAKCGLDFDELVASAKKPGFKAVPLKASGSVHLDVDYEIGSTDNVAAVLPGTDLKDECVVFCAHWDHFGIGTPDESGDAIYNGAADNGSGLAAILMIAEKFTRMPAPRRSILFLAPTSEESGLFGSQYYCEHPAFPMDRTAACINFDCIAPAPLTRDVMILGGGESDLDHYVSAAAASQNRYVVFDRDNSDGWFFRSDHYNFVKRGVPAVVVKYGEDFVHPGYINRYPQSDWYHKPCDEFKDDWDFEGAIANVNLMFGVGVGIANTWPAAKKYVALSFDDGPNVVTTPKVLDVLEENDVPASFFVIGQNINDDSAEMMRRAVSLGCDIENHSWTHSQMPQLSAEQIKDEIEATSAEIEKRIGVRPSFFRPPYISVNRTMFDVIDLTFICGLGCEDWVPEVSAEQRAATVLGSVRDGNILLLHDMEGNDNTVKALKIIIPELKSRGFEFVTVPQLFKLNGVVPEAHNGIVYTNVLQ